MKRSLLFLILTLWGVTLMAHPVDQRVAVRVAQNFVAQRVKTIDTSAASVVYTHVSLNSGEAAIYAVNVGGAFVLVSADDVAHPVLGYSFSRPWPIVPKRPGSYLPSQVSGYLDDLANQIAAAVQQSLSADADITAEWQDLTTNSAPLAPKDVPDSVGPLLTTTWDQGQYYNAMCPEDANGPDGHVYTGCVATAMAQIINYWGYPVHGRGTHSYNSNYGTLSVNYDSASYDFEHMPNVLTYSSSPEEVNAVATLIRDCGIAANMNYNSTESASYNIDARAGLINFFRFSQNLSIAEKAYYSNSEWNDMMHGDIINNHIILYSGTDSLSGGHAFLCDGFNVSNYFHFNFGWSGFADGWYLTSAINPSFFNYQSSQVAVIGVVPDSTASVIIGQTNGISTFNVNQPLDVFNVYGHNVYDSKNKYQCSNIITFISEAPSQQLVLDIINHEDHNVDIYDGIDRNTLLRSLQGRSANNDYDPILSTSNAMTLLYTDNEFSVFPRNGFHLRISEECSCRMVSNITASVDTTMLHLSWVENGSSSEWQVEYGLKGFVRGDGTIQSFFTNAVNIQFPNKFTEYDVYVRSVCGDEEFGPWSPAISITTLAPYWTDIVTEQPAGYIEDDDGNVFISSAEGMAWFTKVSNGLVGQDSYNRFENKIVTLTSEVDMGEYLWTPIGKTSGFMGLVFNGNGFPINNVFINEAPDVGDVGFFSNVGNNANIENVNLKNIHVSGGYATGGLLGSSRFSSHVTIKNSIVTGVIQGGSRSGGLVGYGFYLDMVNCATISEVSGDHLVGNIMGTLSKSTVKNCYSAGKVSFNHSGIGSWIGDIIGYPVESAISHCYSLYNFASVEELFGYIDVSTVDNCSFFFNYENSFYNTQNGPATLVHAVSCDGTYYSDLLEVLNKGVESINAEGLKTWVADTAQNNNGLPLFGDEYLVTCPNVSNVMARNIVNNGEFGVELSWTDTVNRGYWQIRYGQQANPLMQLCDSTVIISAYSNPDTLWGLDMGATYLFNVRPVCDSIHKGAWSEIYSHVVDKPYWTDIVISQPNGFITDNEGNIMISSPEGLAWLISVVNGYNGNVGNSLNGKTVSLTQDIIINQYKWKAINGFEGTFNGLGYTIEGLYINELADNQGLFGDVSHCSIINVVLNDAVVKGYDNVGSICGTASDTEIRNCIVNDTIYGKSNIGGLVGNISKGLIDNCNVNGVVTAEKNASGGILGHAWSLDISNCTTDGLIVSNFYTSGGLIGSCQSTDGDINVQNCFSLARVYSYRYCGGLIGGCSTFYGYKVNVLNSYSACDIYNPDMYMATDKACFVGYANGMLYFEQCYTIDNNNLSLCSEYGSDTTSVHEINTRFFIKNDTTCLLSDTIFLYGNGYSELINVLNSWVTETSDSNYLIWVVDSAGFPVFGGRYQELCPSVEIVCDSFWADGASISWNGNNATEWELEFGIKGFSHGTGSIITIQDTVVLLSGLTTGTEYDIYVRVLCESSHGKWSDRLSIKPDIEYWINIVTAQPEGYQEDFLGNVYVSSAEGLSWLISICNNLNGASNNLYGKTIHLVNDVDISEYKWTPISYFDCNFNGHGHTVNGLYINDDANFATMFGIVRGNICNTIFQKSYVKGRNSALLSEYFSGTILNCGFHGSVYGSNGIAEGVVYHNSGIIQNSYSNVAVYSPLEPVGFLSINTGIVSNCYSAGHIEKKLGTNCAQFSLEDQNPQYNYWLLDSYNFENNISGSAYSSPAEYRSFSGDSISWMLNNPVSFNGPTYYSLVDALNAWVDLYDTSGLYCHWKIDSLGENGGFPVFAPIPCTPAMGSDSITACDSYAWHSNTYTASTTIIDTLTTLNGCDSIVTHHLIVNHPIHTAEIETACNSYFWNGTNYAVGGDYTYSHADANGCTQVDTLHLTVNHPIHIATIEVACDGYTWNGTDYAASGDYTYSHVDANGCMQVDTLHLTINYAGVSRERATACDSYTWKGTTYTQSGEYTFDTLTTAGCDSTITLVLTVNHSTSSVFTVRACDEYTWHRYTYTESTDAPTYTMVGSNECDSVVNLHLTINHSSSGVETVTACNSYVWHDREYTESVDTATFYMPNGNAVGCDSTVTLNLTINHCSTTTLTVCESYTWTSGTGLTYYESGEYYSGEDTLVLTVNHPVHTATTEAACDSYTWNGMDYAVSGDYTYSHADANGCLQVDTLHLTVNYAGISRERATACDSYTWKGTTYTQSGEYTFDTLTTAGCDSTITLVLTVNHSTSSIFTVRACDEYTWHRYTYTESTDEPTYTMLGSNECDSVVNLHLTINHSSSGVESVTACNSYVWHDREYTESTDTATFYMPNGNAVGCDSTVTLNLTINHCSTTTLTVCDSYTWTSGTGLTYYESGEYVSGDDTLVLTVNHPVHTAMTEAACDSYTWNGTDYTTSGDYTYSHADANGCTQVDTLHLTINHSVHTSATETECDTYSWNGTTFNASGDYTYSYVDANGCTQVDTLHLTINHSAETSVSETAENSYTWNGTTYTESGTYSWVGTTAEGCDSTVTLQLTVVASQEGIYEADATAARVYVVGNRIVVDGAEGNPVYLYNAIGQLIKSQRKEEDGVMVIEAPAAGVYMVKVGAYPARKVVVIR